MDTQDGLSHSRNPSPFQKVMGIASAFTLRDTADKSLHPSHALRRARPLRGTNFATNAPHEKPNRKFKVSWFDARRGDTKCAANAGRLPKARGQ
jgi:hypothetical protein